MKLRQNPGAGWVFPWLMLALAPAWLMQWPSHTGLALAAPPPLPPKAAEIRVNITRRSLTELRKRFERLGTLADRNRDWHLALARWEAVASLNRKNRKAGKRIRAIKTLLKKNANRHFKQARAHLKRKNNIQAFKSYLRTLGNDPANRQAKKMVKIELNSKSVIAYKVKRGDTLAKITQAQYRDKNLLYLIQFYNNINNPKDLKRGRVLRLPVMAGVFPWVKTVPARVAAAGKKPRRAAPKPPPLPRRKKAVRPSAVAKKKAPPAPAPQVAQVPAAPASPLMTVAMTAVSALLAEASGPVKNDYDDSASQAKFLAAQRLFKRGRFAQAAAAAEGVLEEDPANGGARRLMNAAFYAEGVRLQGKNENVAAMRNLSRVKPGYKSVDRRLRTLRGRLKDSPAEVHYIAAVTYFLEEDLDNAIREWEQVLRMEPKHGQARKDLANARSLRAKLAQVQ